MEISTDEEILKRIRPYDVEYLYKYREIGSIGLERTFTHNEIYLPDPTKFNDPFDCAPKLGVHKSEYKRKQYYKDIVKRRYPNATSFQVKQELKNNPKVNKIYMPENIQDIFLKFVKQFGIYCLAEVPDDILMWSHYSNSHRGLCLQFNASKESSIIWEAFKVTYQNNYPDVNVMDIGNTKEFFNLVATKSNHWAYEKERRVVKTEDEGGSQIYTFDPELLTGVILGAKISDDDEKTIRSWVDKRSTNVKVFKAKMNSTGYSLDIKGINC